MSHIPYIAAHTAPADRVPFSAWAAILILAIVAYLVVKALAKRSGQ